jgi:hypothetical protein
MNEIEKLKLHLKQAMEIAEANIEKAENIDLVDMAQTLESFIDELNDIGDFERGVNDEDFLEQKGIPIESGANKSRPGHAYLHYEFLSKPEAYFSPIILSL